MVTADLEQRVGVLESEREHLATKSDLARWIGDFDDRLANVENLAIANNRRLRNVESLLANLIRDLPEIINRTLDEREARKSS